MSTTISQIVFHKEIRTIDLPAIEKRFESDANGFNECLRIRTFIVRRIPKDQVFLEKVITAYETQTEE